MNFAGNELIAGHNMNMHRVQVESKWYKIRTIVK